MANTGSKQYNDAQVKAILARALERQRPAEGMSHHELVATAREIGISDAEIERAIVEEAGVGEQTGDREEWRANARRGLRAHFTSWASVALLLFTINALTGGLWWFLIPVLAWGVGLAAHWNAVHLGPSDRALERLRRRRERRLRRDEVRRQIEGGADALGVLVEHGVGALAGHLEERRKRLDAKRDDRG